MSAEPVYYQRLVGMLQELGYKAKYVEDAELIEAGIGGLVVLIYYFESGSIQFFCPTRIAPDAGFGLDQVNAFNRGYRFSKVYLMEDDGAAIEQDFLLDLSSDTAFSELQTIMGLCEASLSLWKEELARARLRVAEAVEADAPSS